jgi:hypothetical protein
MQCTSCGREFQRSTAPGVICQNCWDRSGGARPHRLRRPKLRAAPEHGAGAMVIEGRGVSLVLHSADEPTEVA